jgi:hypothetical protein
MRTALSIFCLGVGGALLSWVLPTVFPKLSSPIPSYILFVAVIMMIVGSVLAFKSPKLDDSAKSEPADGSINVTMGDGNRTGNIGNTLHDKE